MERKVADKIAIQLIEADVEIGFALVEEAKAYCASGQPEFSSRVLQDAEGVVADIERRLQRLGGSDFGPFIPLLRNCATKLQMAERKTF